MMMYTRYFLCKFYYPLALARKENWTKNVHCIFCTNVRQIDEKIDVKIIMSGGTGIFHQIIILKPLCMTFKVFFKTVCLCVLSRSEDKNLKLWQLEFDLKTILFLFPAHAWMGKMFIVLCLPALSRGLWWLGMVYPQELPDEQRS